ncbi:hypothetical protein CBL_12654 [Carabus blaptoides fortunei]
MPNEPQALGDDEKDARRDIPLVSHPFWRSVLLDDASSLFRRGTECSVAVKTPTKLTVPWYWTTPSSSGKYPQSPLRTVQTPPRGDLTECTCYNEPPDDHFDESREFGVQALYIANLI